MQGVVRKSSRSFDRLGPLFFQCRPCGAHSLRIRGTKHRPQRVPRVALVDVVRDVHAVDDKFVDERVDVDVDEPGVADPRVGEIHVAELGAAEVGAPEHGPCKISLELLRHRSLLGHVGLRPPVCTHVRADQLLNRNASSSVLNSRRSSSRSTGWLSSNGSGSTISNAASRARVTNSRSRRKDASLRSLRPFWAVFIIVPSPRRSRSTSASWNPSVDATSASTRGLPTATPSGGCAVTSQQTEAWVPRPTRPRN